MWLQLNIVFMVFIMPVMATTFMIFKHNCFVFVGVLLCVLSVFSVVVVAAKDEKLYFMHINSEFILKHSKINRFITGSLKKNWL